MIQLTFRIADLFISHTCLNRHLVYFYASNKLTGEKNILFIGFNGFDC